MTATELTTYALEMAVSKGLEPVQPGGVRDEEELTVKLQEWVESIARRVYAAWPCLHGDMDAKTFVAESLGDIWLKIELFKSWHDASKFDPKTDPFVAWCRKVLYHNLVNFFRKQQRQCKLVQMVGSVKRSPQSAAARQEEAVKRAAKTDFPISPEQAKVLRQWKPINGITLFVVAGYWHCVPADLRAHWARKANVLHPAELMKISYADKSERRELLAKALRLGSRAAIDKRWQRIKDRLAEYQRELTSRD